MGTGAMEHEVPILKEKLHNWLNTNKRVSLNDAQEMLDAIRTS